MMLKLYTVGRLKAIVLCLVMVCSGTIYSQTDQKSEESTIVMTKSELDSFLSKIADARRSQLKQRESRRVKQDLADLRLKYKQQNLREPDGYDNVSNQEILRELRYLNQRIDNLSSGSNVFPRSNRDNSTIIMPGNAATSQGYQPTERTTTTMIPSNTKKIADLERSIDSLRNFDSSRESYRTETVIPDSLNQVKGRLSDLRRQMQNLELKMKASQKAPKKEEEVKDKSFFSQQVYFDNNSDRLRDEYFQYIQDLTQILIKFPEAKVMLEGWASPIGSATHNKQLSMGRTESVEKAFLNNRIDASRIISSFRGEDKASSEQHARRVDMSIIVR
ncbi:OmpA family protein [Flavobacterium sp.]